MTIRQEFYHLFALVTETDGLDVGWFMQVG